MRKERVFQVFDCVAAGGYSMAGYPYSTALGFAKSVCDTVSSPSGRLRLEMKPTAKCSQRKQAQSIVSQFQELEARGQADGLVFTHEDRLLRNGPRKNILKYKTVPTIDIGYSPHTK